MIKVRIESLGRIDSSYYKYLLEYPPKNVYYLNKIEKTEDLLITSSSSFLKRLKIKKIIHKLFKYSNLPKIKKTKYDGVVDLYHSAHTFLITKKPYIIDFEHFWILSFTSESAYGFLGKRLIKKLFRKNNLKFILPWTHAAYRSIPEEIIRDPLIKEKIKVVYPAVPVEDYPKKSYDTIRIIAVTRYGFLKGEPLVFKIFKKLYKIFNNNIELIVVSPLAKNKTITKKFNFIKFYDLMPQNKLFKLFEKSHVLVYTREIDTFGFIILESTSRGAVPVVIDGFARKEIVNDKITGYVIEKSDNYTSIIDDFVEKISNLIENKNLLKKMSKNAYNEVKCGKFSIENRNKTLLNIILNSLETN